MQHPIKHACSIRLKNRWNIWNRRLQHTCIITTTYATSRSTFATSIWNTCNIPLKHLKHLKYMLTTYTFNVTSPCCLGEWRLVCMWSSPEAVAPVSLVGGGCAMRLGGRSCMTRRGQPSVVARRQLRVMPGRANGRELCLRGTGGGGGTETKRHNEWLLVWICVEKPKRHMHI
jgi:hypothetical protein